MWYIIRINHSTLSLSLSLYDHFSTALLLGVAWDDDDDDAVKGSGHVCTLRYQPAFHRDSSRAENQTRDFPNTKHVF